uniref:hypothetical protein n=1 Tax=Bacillus cytotoxicus TaxID=580165 RepID=UPI0020405574
MLCLRQKEEARAGPVVFCVAEIYVLKNQHKKPSFLVCESSWLCVEAVRACFCHVPCLRQKEGARAGYVVFCEACEHLVFYVT